MIKQKNSRLFWDIGLLCALYVALPEYFALEFSQKLPLLTASRLLLVLAGCMLILRNRQSVLSVRRWSLKALRPELTKDRFLRCCILVYFAILILVNLTFIPSSDAIKELFVLVAEQYFLMWLLVRIFDTRQKLMTGLRLLVYSSGVVAVLAAVSMIADYNVFHFLKTTQRAMLMSDYYRQGMLRAATGFGHPVYYGAFCAIMLPICMYFAENEQSCKLRLAAAGCMAMNLVGLILSNSRGSILAVGCMVVFIFLLRLIARTWKAFLKVCIPVLAVALVVLILVTAMTPAGTRYLSSVAQSMGDTLSSLLPGSDASKPGQSGTPGESEGALPPDKDEVEFGENPNGVRSRTVQLTGILWTLEREPLLGLGPNAHKNGLLYYRFDGNWQRARSLDIAPVSMISQFGLLGFLGFVVLYLGFFKTYLDKRYRKDPLMHHLFLCFVSYGLCLLSISDLDKLEWILLAATVSLVNIIRTEQEA